MDTDGAADNAADSAPWGQFISEVFECAAGHASERRLQAMHAAAFPGRPFSPASRAAIVDFLLHELPASMWETPQARDALHHDPATVQVK